jgi:hypothetical protein
VLADQPEAFVQPAQDLTGDGRTRPPIANVVGAEYSLTVMEFAVLIAVFMQGVLHGESRKRGMGFC